MTFRPDVMPSSSRIKGSSYLGCLSLEDDATTFLRNAVNHTPKHLNPNNTAVRTSDRGSIELQILEGETQFASILHSISSRVLTLRISFLEISYVSLQWRE